MAVGLHRAPLRKALMRNTRPFARRCHPGVAPSVSPSAAPSAAWAPSSRSSAVSCGRSGVMVCSRSCAG
jgi:hypothetical protein